MSAYPVKNLATAGVVYVGSSQTDVVLGLSGLTGEGARSLRVNVKAEDVTIATGVTVQLQHLIADEYVDLTSANSSVAITAAGVYSIKMDIEIAADQADMPLSKQLRVVCSSGAGDEATFTTIDLLQAST